VSGDIDPAQFIETDLIIELRHLQSSGATVSRTRRWTAIAVWALAYVSLVAVLHWSANLALSSLVVSLAALVAALALMVWARGSRLLSPPLFLALAVLGIAVGWGGFTRFRLANLAGEWPSIIADRQQRLHEQLDQRADRIVERGRLTASVAANRAAGSDSAALFEMLGQLQEESGVAALALFAENGQLVAWAGEHRGRLPDSVRLARTRASFVEQPLYSYVYFSTPVTGRRMHAVSAVLLGTALPEHAADRTISREVRELVRQGATFRPGAGPPRSWPLVVRNDTIAHARLATITQARWRDQVVTVSQRVTLGLAALALLLIGIAWLRRPNRRLATTIPLLASAGALAVAPIGALGLDSLYSPGLFLLPMPGDISLGTMLGVLLALAAVAATMAGKVGFPRWPTLLLTAGALVVALGYPGAIRLLIGPGAADVDDEVLASTTMLLLGGPTMWFGLQMAAVLLLGIITEFVLPRWNWASPQQLTTNWRSPWVFMLAGALATSAALGMTVLLIGQTEHGLSPWFAATWSLPFLLTAFAVAAFRGRGVRLLRWLCAGWLAATAVLPFMWIAHVDARLDAAERELATLGSNRDPFLEYLLQQFAGEMVERAEQGEDGVQLLYRSWVGSGLAREAYSARLTLWSRAGFPEAQLLLGEMQDAGAERATTVPLYLQSGFARVREFNTPEVMRVQQVPDVNEALISPIDSLRIVTVEVPPRRTLERSSVPFLRASGEEETTLELVTARPGTAVHAQVWNPSDNGWRSEAIVRYPEGDYHAHMEVKLPRIGVRLARGVLLLAFDLGIFALLWLLGRAARGEHLALREVWRRWRGSFRARVTAALFIFFLVPTAVFGWVAFTALAREVQRATQIVAERAARTAVVEFAAVSSDLGELAAHAGAEILYYLQGELAGAASPEALELGIYGAWMDPEVFQILESGEEDAASASRQIFGENVLIAYRTLTARSGALAVPLSLEAGDTRFRQRELAHLILFAALVGGLLSLALSVVVGRALTGPIGRLQRAASAVGAGNLRIKLPEATGDEFGKLYASFNQMVRRLRRARSQQVRSARVLAWGEMARQVAHEIKNPLTPIKLAVQHLRRAHADRRPDFGEVLDRNVEQVLLEIDRLADIARAFSRYGAPATSSGPLQPVAVDQVVHEAITLYRAGDPEIDYREDVDADLPRVFGRNAELKEVLINLLENARAAVDKDGMITVAARRNGQDVEILVRDNGPGIPADLLARVFEPHFSTRSTGTGLGLAIVRRLVEGWGGQVAAESEEGRGTTIRIVLRAASDYLTL
jgi:signal transduction histidine kinase